MGSHRQSLSDPEINASASSLNGKFMSTCQLPTDEQRAAGKPWAIAMMVIVVAASVSYAAAAVYAAIGCLTTGSPSVLKFPGLWVLGTTAAWRSGSHICMSRMQKITGALPIGGAGFWRDNGFNFLLTGAMACLLCWS
jgi:hypothetical protein